MDTGNDPRFALVEKALQDCKRVFQMGRLKAQFPKQKAMDAVDAAHSALMTVRYSYAEPAQIRETFEFKAIGKAMDDVETVLGGAGIEERFKEAPLEAALVAWAIDNTRSLGRRLDLAGNEFETAVDVVQGRVISATKHPQADNLLVTRVAAGRAMRVVTNDTTVKAEDQVGVALLPPVDLRGVVSTGMFLGAGKGILKGVTAGPDGRPKVPPEAFGETRSMVGKYIQGK